MTKNNKTLGLEFSLIENPKTKKNYKNRTSFYI